MYHRIIKGESWDDIEKLFEHYFVRRTKDALNSVYYRTRQDWDMESVLSGDSESDMLKVEEKARTIPRDFLQRISYRHGERRSATR